MRNRRYTGSGIVTHSVKKGLDRHSGREFHAFDNDVGGVGVPIENFKIGRVDDVVIRFLIERGARRLELLKREFGDSERVR